MGEVVSFERRSRFTPEPFADVQPLAQPWRIKGVLPSRGVAFIVGQSKAGKSFLAIDTTLRIASGANVFGRNARACGVAYIAAEDPNGCRARVAAWRLAKHRISPTPFELIPQGFNLLDEGDLSDLKATMGDVAKRFDDQGSSLGLIVIDTLSRCIPGVDENSSTDMSRAFSALEQIEKATGALILVVAHFGKAGGDKGIRGWSGFDANSDATITLERDAEDPHLRTLTFAKVKNGIDGGKLSFRLEPVGLGLYDEDGDELTSCVPAFEEASDTPRPKRQRALNPAETLVLKSIRHVTDHGFTLPLPTSVEGAKAWMKAVRKADVRTRALTSGLAGAEDEKPDAVRKRFDRALEAVVATGKARKEGDLIWLL